MLQAQPLAILFLLYLGSGFSEKLLESKNKGLHERKGSYMVENEALTSKAWGNRCKMQHSCV
eukprot:37280-Pelagomonas_calceolata.AAC.3